MSDEIDRHVLKRYDIVQKLGKGAYGIVWRATDKKTKETVALKKIFDAFQNQTDAQRTFREVEVRILVAFNSCCTSQTPPLKRSAYARPRPCLSARPYCTPPHSRALTATARLLTQFLKAVKPHEHIIAIQSVLKADNDRDLYLTFEYMETDLHASIRANILQDIHKQYIMWQLLKALKFMHSANLLHRDIKPSNLLLNSDCLMKVPHPHLIQALLSALLTQALLSALLIQALLSALLTLTSSKLSSPLSSSKLSSPLSSPKL